LGGLREMENKTESTWSDKPEEITTVKKEEIYCKPDAEKLWPTLGGHFDNFSQVACEIIDDSVSNFIGNNLQSRFIQIEVSDKGDMVDVRIEDDGTGIKNLNIAFELGNTSGRESPYNAHGCGMKHAIACAVPNNDLWTIYTRTEEDVELMVYKEISAPYSFNNFYALTKNDKWPGRFNTSGTIVEFTCSKKFLETLAIGKEEKDRAFDRLMEIFLEDLGHTYAPLIKNSVVQMTVRFVDSTGKAHSVSVEAVEPIWVEEYHPGEGSIKVDLGGGCVNLYYKFGRIKERKEYFRFYKHNQSSAGCEIRVNGRVLEYNLFTEIWGKVMHPEYNGFIAIINVESTDIRALPMTRTSKTGFRQGDAKLAKLYEKIRAMMPSPPKRKPEGTTEAELVQKLADKEKKQIKGNPTISTEQAVLIDLDERAIIDLYVSYDDIVQVYEAKKIKTKAQDAYQLMFYWDALAFDGIQATEGILIAARHPKSVVETIERINGRFDTNGNKYNFTLKTWAEEGI